MDFDVYIISAQAGLTLDIINNFESKKMQSGRGKSFPFFFSFFFLGFPIDGPILCP